ncbi:unnamed protein product [Fraxinus pennsylvanica]|uniref:Uncharacterized protein n=1 Tax=Fraxinus pennsylvanica TaxID=56036 RepID=A0AAD2AAU8_9LAMI|nr:unnamed protein product [Fraxinus pennsylvanica]
MSEDVELEITVLDPTRNCVEEACYAQAVDVQQLKESKIAVGFAVKGSVGGYCKTEGFIGFGSDLWWLPLSGVGGWMKERESENDVLVVPNYTPRKGIFGNVPRFLFCQNRTVALPTLLNNQSPGAEGAVQFTLGLEIKRHKAEPPTALHVHGLNHTAAVRTRPRRRLPTDYSLILVTNKNQTHLLRSISGILSAFDTELLRSE